MGIKSSSASLSYKRPSSMPPREVTKRCALVSAEGPDPPLTKPALPTPTAQSTMDADRPVVDAPEWFLRNCVRTPPEINRLAAKISLRGTPARKEDVAKASSSSPSGAVSRKAKDGPSSKGASSARYEVEPCIYNEFLGLIAAKEKEADGVSFADDAILVRLPDGDYPGRDFLVSMAAKFASDIEADLIVLDYDDLHDLAEFFYMRHNLKPPEANATFVEAFLKPLPKNKPKMPKKKPTSASGSNPPIEPIPADGPGSGSDSGSDSNSDSDLSLGSDSDLDSGPDSDSDAKSTSESILSLDSTSKPRQTIGEPQPRPPPTFTTRYLLSNRGDKMASLYSGQAFRSSREAGISPSVLPSLPQLFSSTVSGFMTIPWFFSWLSGLRRARIESGEPAPIIKPPPVRDPIKENAATFFRTVLSSPHARAALDERNEKEKEKQTVVAVDEVKENGVKEDDVTKSEVQQNGVEESAIKQNGVNESEVEPNTDGIKESEIKENGVVKVNGVHENKVQVDQVEGKEVVENAVKVNGVKKEPEAKVNGAKEEHEVKVNGAKEEHEEKVNGVKEEQEEKSEEKRDDSNDKGETAEKDANDEKNEKPPANQAKPRGHFTFQDPKADNVRPIIIVIPQLEKFGRLANFAFRGLKILKSSSPHLKKRLLTITTTSRSDKPPSSAGRRPINPFPDTPPQPEPPRVSLFSVRHFGLRPNLYEQLIFPARSPAQIASFADDKDQVSQRHSIRALQREVRRHKGYRDKPHLQPYAEWNIPDSDSDPVAKYLRGGKLLALDESVKVALTLTKTKKAANLSDILGVLTQVSQGSDALSKWNERDAKGGSSADLPQRVVRVIKRVTEEAERSCSEFNAELEIMKTLVHPSELSQGWSEIEVAPAIKSRVQRMISLLNRRAELTGILKKSAMGGVILYGPPGTGKTHLARVIAKETSSVMLRVSAAEIERTWAGEAEKVIQALFKLAREIYPCIVFIDEADSIFGRRRDSDKNWERKITNQLLGEFGGFENDISSPLLLLATNFPNDLDPAVLRRAPNRLYMGLPSTPSRQNIFKICLREEKIDKSVDLEELAEKTSGYTGSDIEYICQQAAMAALEDFESNGSEDHDSDGICLKMSHFSQTLTGASPSVSGPSMTGIESFAREYDRSSVDMIKRTTDEFGGFSSYLYI